jgi:indolepyruvate ferredoxin oxidoreductase alpha subunit
MSKAPLPEILQSNPDTAACLLGNLAIVRGALEAGVQFFSCYPGTPSSEVGDTFARIAAEADLIFEYSVNEKTAVEITFAASLTGARSMCAMKHLGFNYAGDPLSTMPYVGVEGGLVIVSAGDPSAITSPNEQDQRHFSRFLYYPLFDPATAADALAMTRYAFELSEQTRLPVIMRPTTRVCHVSGVVELGPLPAKRNTIHFEKNPARYVPIPVNARRMRKELSERFALAESLLAKSGFFPRTGQGSYGIVASGVAYAYVSQVVQELDIMDRVSLLQIGAYPIPEGVLTEFLASVESVLVVEELTPYIEEQVVLNAFGNRFSLPILGKNSGHFPLEFEYDPDLVETKIREYLHLEPRTVAPVPEVDLPARPPVLCPGCPHRASFFLMQKVFGKKTVYANDIGCYTLGYGTPLNSCDVLLSMGASISMASGIARVTGSRTVAYIGDSTFFHSGLPALVNAVKNDDNVTVCILNNYVTAMTGFQPSPVAADSSRESASGKSGLDTSGLDLEQVVRGLGVRNVYSMNPFEIDTSIELLKQAKADQGLNVVISNAPCVVHERRVGVVQEQPPFTIDQELCDDCSLCVRRLGCPGINVTDGRYSIDPNNCNGCGLCAYVCNKDAIIRAGENVSS